MTARALLFVALACACSGSSATDTDAAPDTLSDDSCTTPMCVRYCIVDDAAHGCAAGTTCHPLEFFDAKLYGLCF